MELIKFLTPHAVFADKITGENANAVNLDAYSWNENILFENQLYCWYASSKICLGNKCVNFFDVSYSGEFIFSAYSVPFHLKIPVS